MIRGIRRKNKKNGTRLKPPVPNFSLWTTKPQHPPFNVEERELAGAGFWGGDWTGFPHGKKGISFNNGARKKVSKTCAPILAVALWVPNVLLGLASLSILVLFGVVLDSAQEPPLGLCWNPFSWFLKLLWNPGLRIRPPVHSSKTPRLGKEAPESKNPKSAIWGFQLRNPLLPPKGPFRTKNTTTIAKIVNYYAVVFLLRPPDLLRHGPFSEREMSVIARKMVSAQVARRDSKSQGDSKNTYYA